MPKKPIRKKATSTNKQSKATSVNAAAQGANQTQKQPQMNSVDVLKQNLKGVNKGGLLEMLNKVKNTNQEDWKDPETVRNMAKRFAQQLNLPVSEERLNAFMNAFTDATKNSGANGPDANVESLVKKYGKGVADDSLLKEMKKFVKPNE
ncbi:hypothetical protein LSG31_05130 [Fodinisporobacter ferrooxydans]|uniref:Uncharacterized protein n=1 Tax=Fodinisporobacter ferrooxydans TaxID=2901836 RepID=A0ABY4CUS0_9BACL|nr:hypothetical protein LSG31_05130 [Alicyclobacillaceae bacterium MYW30-H2]